MVRLFLILCFICIKTTISAKPNDFETTMKKKCGHTWTFVSSKIDKCMFLHQKGVSYDQLVKDCNFYQSYPFAIKNAEDQSFLENFIKSNNAKINIWIGLKYTDGNYEWPDRSKPTYFNWETRNGTNEKDSDDSLDNDHCVRINVGSENFGTWSKVACGEKNAIMCEKMLKLTLEDFQTLMGNIVTRIAHIERDTKTSQGDISVLKKEVTKVSDQFTQSKNSLGSMENNIQSFKTEIKKEVKKVSEDFTQSKTSLGTMENNIQSFKTEIKKIKETCAIPVGMVYVQLPGTATPQKLWPSTKWKDISEDYADVFFRVRGSSTPFTKAVQPSHFPTLEITLTGMPNVPMSHTDEIYQVLDNGEFRRPGVVTAQRFEKWDGDPKHLFLGHLLRWQPNTYNVVPKHMGIQIWERTE